MAYKNPDDVKKYYKKYVEKYPNRNKEYYAAHREEILEQKKEYREQNKEEINRKNSERVKKNRDNWLFGKHCVWIMSDGGECGSTENLEADHIIPRKISGKPRIKWSWGSKKLQEELLHCQPLCQKHHKEKTFIGSEYLRGEESPRSTLTEQVVREIRKKYNTGNYKQRELAKEYRVSGQTISKVINRKLWTHVK